MKFRFVYLVLICATFSLVAGNDCCEKYYSGCETPLHCGQWSIVPKGGVAPTIRTAQDPVWLINPCLNLSGPITGCENTPPNPTSPVFTVSKTAKFQNQFKTPFIVGFELQYALDDYHMVYLEYAYRQAKAKVFPFTAGLFQVCERFTNYSSSAGYLGARQYFNRIWCEHLAFFVGLKIGILHRKQVCYNLNLAVPSFDVPLTTIADNPYFFADNVVSGGLHLGFDYCFNCNWSFQFNAEVVASAGPKVNQNVRFGQDAGQTDPAILAALGGLTNVNIGATGTEVYFPVTFGIRYNF